MLQTAISGYINGSKRLVVPGFGTFLHKENGKIVFVEFLKKDDGVLVSMLIRDYVMSEEQAREAIADFVLTIKKSIGATGSYIIAGVGTMGTDANGLYELTYNPNIRAAVTPAAETPGTDEPQDSAESEPIDLEEPQPGHTTESQRADAPLVLDMTEEPMPTSIPRPKQEKQEESLGKKIFNDYFDEQQSAAAPTHREEAAPPKPEQRPRPSEQPQRTHTAHPAPVRKKRASNRRADLIVVIAVTAALIAIGSMIYGIMVESKPANMIQPTTVDNGAAPQSDTIPTPVE
jgi:hypothetical protein